MNILKNEEKNILTFMHLFKIMKTKNLIIGLGILCLNAVAYAQGLEGIVVEKYYLTNDADGANALSNDAITTLNTGTTVYRVYVDMAAGYKYSQIFHDSRVLKVNVYTQIHRFFLRWREVCNVRRHVSICCILEITSDLRIQTDKVGQRDKVGTRHIHGHAFNVFQLALWNAVAQLHVTQTRIRSVVQPKVGVDPFCIRTIGTVITA